MLYREGVGIVGTNASLKSISMVVFANAHLKSMSMVVFANAHGNLNPKL